MTTVPVLAFQMFRCAALSEAGEQKACSDKEAYRGNKEDCSTLKRRAFVWGIQRIRRGTLDRFQGLVVVHEPALLFDRRSVSEERK
jgi:hypothetical protein